MPKKSIVSYAFYNNKGGVGKTTLCQNAACLYAESHPKTLVLVVDCCPQANISQFLLGGGHVGFQKNQQIQQHATRKNVVGFVDHLLRGNQNFTSLKTEFRTQVSKHNHYTADNLYLIAGDGFLESLSLALNYAVINPANTQAWKEYMTAFRRLCEHELEMSDYAQAVVFYDCNPSFSIYTQMALLSADRLIIPMMADFTSVEGIKGVFSLLYGKYPSAAFERYASNIVTFTKQVGSFSLDLPTVFELVFNNYTIKAGIATAFSSIRDELVQFCWEQYGKFPHLFMPIQSDDDEDDDAPPASNMEEWKSIYLSDIKDFHTAGKVSASLGIPLHRLPERQNYTMPDGDHVALSKDQYSVSLGEIQKFVDKII